VAAQTLWTAANGKYLRDLLLPWSGLSLLGPAALLPALPTLLINLLSGWEPMHIIQFQYTAFLIPFFTASAIQGAARVFHWGVERVHSWRPDRPREYGRRLTLTALCYLLLMGNVLSHSPLALGGLWTQRRNELRQGGKERAAFLQTVRSLPPEAAVSASSHYLTLVTHRRRAYLFPNPAWPYRWGGQVMYEPQVTPEETAERLRRSGIDYVILNPRNPWPLKKKDFRACLEDVERSDLFEVVARYQTSVLFRRVRTERAQKEDKG
jgi:hypothetical protein